VSRPLDGCGISIGAPAAWHFVSHFLRVGCVGLCFYRVRFVRFYPLCSFIAAWIAAYLYHVRLCSIPRLFLVCLACPICTIFYIITDLRRQKVCTWYACFYTVSILYMIPPALGVFSVLIACIMPANSVRLCSIVSLLFRC